MTDRASWSGFAALTLIAVSGAFAFAQRPADVLERHSVVAGGHTIAVWSRRPADDPLAVVLLVHGRTWSTRPDWDLQVSGSERSVMRSLAARRIAAYGVDLRGYGETSRDTTGWNTPRRSAEDVLAVLAWMRQRHPSLSPPALVGWSRGGAVAMLAAQLKPEAITSLVLFGFSWDPALEFPDVEEPKGPPARVPNTTEAAASDFISPRVTQSSVIKAFVTQALAADPILADLKGDSDYKELSASRVTTPTLVVFGGRDPAFDRGGTERFVDALATQTKRLLVLPGADHAAQLENTHGQWVDAVVAFVKGTR